MRYVVLSYGLLCRRGQRLVLLALICSLSLCPKASVDDCVLAVELLEMIEYSFARTFLEEIYVVMMSCVGRSYLFSRCDHLFETDV